MIIQLYSKLKYCFSFGYLIASIFWLTLSSVKTFWCIFYIISPRIFCCYSTESTLFSREFILTSFIFNYFFIFYIYSFIIWISFIIEFCNYFYELLSSIWECSSGYWAIPLIAIASLKRPRPASCCIISSLPVYFDTCSKNSISSCCLTKLYIWFFKYLIFSLVNLNFRTRYSYVLDEN